MYKTVSIVVHYNNIWDTIKCVESIIYSKENIKIVIVANGSQVGQEINKLKIYKEVKLIKNEKNVGFGRGNNIGIRYVLKKMKCKYLLLMNNDAILENNTLTLLEKELDKNKKIGIISPKIVFMDDPSKLWYGGGKINWFKGKGKINGFFGADNNSCLRQPQDVDFISGCTMLVRREVFENIGGFDPRFFMYEEDLEFCLRTKKAGWRLGYIDNCIVKHKVQGANRKGKKQFYPALHYKNKALKFYVYHITRNRLLNMHIHAKGVNKIKFIFGFPVDLFKNVTIYLCAGKINEIKELIRALQDYRIIKNKEYINELN